MTKAEHGVSPSAHGVLRDLLNLLVGVLAALTVVNASFVALPFVSVATVTLGLLLTKKFNATDVGFIALAVLATASLMWTLAPLHSQGALLTQLGCLGVFLLVRATVTHRRALVLTCAGYVLGCLLAVRTIHQRLGGFDFRALTGEGNRVALDGLNANYLAYALALGLAVCLIANLARPKTMGRLTLLASAGTLMAGIAMTGTRAAFLAVGLLGLWVVLGSKVRGRALLRMLVVASALGAITIATGLFNILASRVVVQSERENGTLNNRLPTWERAGEVFLEHPLIGAGVGSFRDLNDLGIVAHNGFLEVASGLGVLGLALLTFTLSRTLLTETKALPDRARNLIVGSVIAVTAPCLLSGDWVQSPAMWAVLGLITRIGIALDLKQPPHDATANGATPRSRVAVTT